MAIPGRTPWARASPMKARPRRITQVPTTDVVRAASTPAARARCMKSNEKGWVSQSTADSP